MLSCSEREREGEREKERKTDRQKQRHTGMQSKQKGRASERASEREEKREEKRREEAPQRSRSCACAQLRQLGCRAGLWPGRHAGRAKSKPSLATLSHRMYQFNDFQLPHEIVNFLFTTASPNNKLTILWRS